jgi:diaminopimelate dehydrogenase
MTRWRLAVVGWGRLGQACAAALQDMPDLALAGVVRRVGSIESPPGREVRGVPCVAHVRDLGAVDAALLCVPAEAAPGAAQELLQMRVPLVECASLEGRALRDHHERIAHLAARHHVGVVVGAGWDPGVLPQVRHLFELLIPQGHTRVGRHVASGLHHTAATEGLAGVRAALSCETTDVSGGARRYVYVQLARGADAERVRRQIEGDPLFADEPTQVLDVPDLAALAAEDRGVLVERLGDGVGGPHASLLLEARFDEATFCARLMLDGARALAGLPRRAWRYTPFGLVPLAEAAADDAHRPGAPDRTHAPP